LSFEKEKKADDKASFASYASGEQRITSLKRKWYESILCDDHDILFPQPALIYRKVTRHEYLQEPEQVLSFFDKNKERKKEKRSNNTQHPITTPSQVLSGRIALFKSRSTPDFDNPS